jgi:CBS domain-containing protein
VGLIVVTTSNQTEVKIKDVMTSTVVTVGMTDPVDQIAKLMAKDDIGSIIVVDKKGKPVGMVTDMDLVKRVTAKNLLPSKLSAKEVMTKPLVTIDSEMDVTEAARKMTQLRIRRLAVVDKGKLTGIIAGKDIVRITPALIDMVTEKSRITGFVPKEKSTLAGHCDKCDNWSDNLKEHDGHFLCEDCTADEKRNPHEDELEEPPR